MDKNVLCFLSIITIIFFFLIYKKLSKEDYEVQFANITCDGDEHTFNIQEICSDLFPDICPPGITLSQMATQALNQYIPQDYTIEINLDGGIVKFYNIVSGPTQIWFDTLSGVMYPCQSLGDCCGTVFNGIEVKKTCIVFDMTVNIHMDSISCSYKFFNTLGNTTTTNSSMKIGAQVLFVLDCDTNKFFIQDAIVKDTSSWNADPNTLGKLINSLNNTQIYKKNLLAMFKGLIIKSGITFDVPEEIKNYLCL